MDGEVWGEARVTHPDWHGTAQLDERKTAPWEGLARTVGLNSEQWQAIGFSIGGGEHGYHLRVLATPRDMWETAKLEDGAGVEVTEFLVHDVDPLEILQRMTHMFQLNMRIRDLGTVHISERSDLHLERSAEEDVGPR